MRRVYLAGCQFRPLSGGFQDISHSDEERLENLDPVVYEHFGLKDASEIKVKTHQTNVRRSRDKLEKGMIIANQDKFFAKAAVTKNLSDHEFRRLFSEANYQRLPIARSF